MNATTLLVAVIGSITGVAGLLVGRRQRKAAARDLEAQIYDRLIRALEGEMGRMQDRIAVLEQRLASYDLREQELLRELAELRRERDSLHTQLAAAQATIAAQREQVARMAGLTEHAQAQLGVANS